MSRKVHRHIDRARVLGREAALCPGELTVSPTWNRGFVAQAKALTR